MVQAPASWRDPQRGQQAWRNRSLDRPIRLRRYNPPSSRPTRAFFQLAGASVLSRLGFGMSRPAPRYWARFFFYRQMDRSNKAAVKLLRLRVEFINQDRAFERELLVPTIRPRSRPCRERPGRQRGARSARETANTIRSRARPRGRTRSRLGRRRVPRKCRD